MNMIIISGDNKILHIINYGYEAEYTLYNNKGKYITSGILESVNKKFNNDNLITEIIKLIREDRTFIEPYIYLYGSESIPLLSLIKYENNKRSQVMLLEELNSLNQKSEFFYNQRRLNYYE